MISLVDVVLLLVIFFMLSTTFVQDSRLRVELPEAGSASAERAASPIVITSNGHGFQNGDIVVHRGIGGNTAANGTFRVASQTTNTYAIVTVKDGLNTTGNDAYTSGGCAIDLTLGDDFADIDAAVVSTPVALANKMGAYVASAPGATPRLPFTS